MSGMREAQKVPNEMSGASYPLAQEAAARIRRIAEDVLRHAFPVLVRERVLPQRFAEKIPSTDYRWGYGGALVEAAVAAATLADDPYDVGSASVQRVLDEFIEKIQATPRSTVLVVVSDLDVQ